MENINRYIEEIKKYIKENPDLEEDILVRYVFLDLSKRLSFDLNYISFGNSKKRQELYRNARYTSEIDKCLETNIVICNTAAKLLELILKELGVNIITKTAKGDIRKCPHVYNLITPSTGKDEYIVDIQEDMYRVKMNGRTPNYGLSEDNECVISLFEQEEMDIKIGYIDKNNYYTDDYLYLLKSDINYMDNLYDKLKLILENIEVFENDNINYIDRQWYHVRLLETLFTKETFDYNNNTGSIRIIDCYKDIEGNKNCINCITVEDKGQTHIFIYNKKEYRYKEIELENFINAIKNGLVLYKSKIKEVEKRLSRRQ